MFEIVNTQNGMVLAEISNRQQALMWAAEWSNDNGFDYIEVLDTENLVLIIKQGSQFHYEFNKSSNSCN
jgi:hypothetical protein